LSETLVASNKHVCTSARFNVGSYDFYDSTYATLAVEKDIILFLTLAGRWPFW